MLFPPIIPIEDLRNVHPWVKSLFSARKITNLPLAGRLKHFLEACEILTKDSEILEIVKGFKIPFLKRPTQERVPQTPHMDQEQADLILVEIENMLKKGAIQQTEHQAGEFISNISLVGKRDGGNRPVVNLRYLNQFIPYQHFKMKGLFCLRELLQEEDYMCKVDMKDTYFSVPLHQSSRNYVSFSWSGSLYEFLCLYFGLGTAPRIFTKLPKIPVSVLRRINIRMVIYLDNMLIMGQTMEEILMSRDTVIFLLQHLGFVLNLEKSILNSVQEIEFLGVTINSLKMCLSLPQGDKNLESLSGCSCQRSGDSSGTNKIVRSSCLKNLGSFASSGECSVSSAKANKSIESNSMLSSNCITQQQFKGGTSVVDPKSPDFQ